MVAKCCEIAKKGQDTSVVDGDRIFCNGWRISAQVIEDEIRAAFPAQEDGR